MLVASLQVTHNFSSNVQLAPLLPVVTHLNWVGSFPVRLPLIPQVSEVDAQPETAPVNLSPVAVDVQVLSNLAAYVRQSLSANYASTAAIVSAAQKSFI